MGEGGDVGVGGLDFEVDHVVVTILFIVYDILWAYDNIIKGPQNKRNICQQVHLPTNTLPPHCFHINIPTLEFQHQRNMIWFFYTFYLDFIIQHNIQYLTNLYYIG